MRLLNVETFEFTVFYADIPDYVIASHRWLGGQEAEASFQQVESISKQDTSIAGYKKVKSFATYVKKHIPHVRWLWIDTCCINKQDAQEVSEAINSMFKWYSQATVCVAYLVDVESPTDLDAFEQSEWFARGWTLQELLAPRTVVFVTRDWYVIGHKGNGSPGSLRTGPALEDVIAKRTGIPVAVLQDYSQSQGLTWEEKLRWMDGRTTSKEEDMSYSLFGILDIALGANYGEGKARANKRLQQAIASEKPLYQTLLSLTTRETRDRQPKPSSNVPFKRDRDFIKREALMDDISQRLSGAAARIALVGLGGVGKSQLAIEYSYCYQKLFPSSCVIWIHASNATRFEQSIRDFVTLAKVADAQDPKADILRALRAWLWDKRNGRWLIILDNADNVDFLVDCDDRNTSLVFTNFQIFPVCDHGSMIITSRNRLAAERLVDYGDIIDIPPMDHDTALAFLDQKLDKQTAGSDQSDRGDLVTALEYMPLAITQAVAFLRRRGRRYSIRKYLETLRSIDQSKEGLLDVDNGDLRRDRDASNSIILTWQISFEYISQTRRSAAELLSLMCLCDRQTIPETLINNDATWPAQQQCFEDDIEMLLGFSFITTASEDASTFQMHRLVQLATMRWLTVQGSIVLHTKRLIGKLDQTMPWSEHANWLVCESLLPHIWSTIDLMPQEQSSALTWARILDKGARYAIEKGGILLWKQAIIMEERCREVRERQLGEKHPDILVLMSNIAWCYVQLGEYAKAAAMMEPVWVSSKSQLGEGHPNMLEFKSALALFYAQLGDRTKAAEMGKRCWEASKRQLGEEHPTTLTLMNNLAISYIQLGDSAKAAETGKLCLEMMRRALGEEHPNTLTSTSNLASYYSQLGDSAKAVKMGKRCTEMMKRMLGEGHPNTLTSTSNLAWYYGQLGDITKALEIEEQCWEVKRRVLGKEHPQTLSSISNLARYYHQLGDSGKAVEMGESYWESSKRVLGEEHPSTLVARRKLLEFRELLEASAQPTTKNGSSESVNDQFDDPGRSHDGS